MKVDTVDLNLLVVLDAVLEEGSVSRAAGRLNMSVPAVSRALGRCRAVFRDPLMVRSGRGLQPTATAVNLRPQVRDLIRQARDLLDPVDIGSALARTFTIMAPADVLASAGPALLARVAAHAPQAQLRLLGADRTCDEADAVRDGTADVAVSVNAAKHTDLHARGLVREPLTAVVRTGHDLAAGPVTPERFVTWPRVAISRHGRLASSLDTALADRGHAPAVRCCVPDFVTGLQLAAASDLVTIAPLSLVTRLQAALGLTAIEAPLTLRPLRVSQLWHPRHHHDPAHQWLRAQLQELAAGHAG